MLVVGSILLALFGLQFGMCGLTGLRNRPKWLAMAANQPEAKQQAILRAFGFGLISMWLAQSASMLLASTLLWFNLTWALILGLWPGAFWLIVVVLSKRGRAPTHRKCPPETRRQWSSRSQEACAFRDFASR